MRVKSWVHVGRKFALLSHSSSSRGARADKELLSPPAAITRSQLPNPTSCQSNILYTLLLENTKKIIFILCCPSTEDHTPHTSTSRVGKGSWEIGQWALNSNQLWVSLPGNGGLLLSGWCLSMKIMVRAENPWKETSHTVLKFQTQVFVSSLEKKKRTRAGFLLLTLCTHDPAQLNMNSSNFDFYLRVSLRFGCRWLLSRKERGCKGRELKTQTSAFCKVEGEMQHYSVLQEIFVSRSNIFLPEWKKNRDKSEDRQRKQPRLLLIKTSLLPHLELPFFLYLRQAEVR